MQMVEHSRITPRVEGSREKDGPAMEMSCECPA